MPSQTIPCSDCDEARQRLQRAGFVVLGCSPHPTRAEMCSISFAAAATVAQPPAQATATAGNAHADADAPAAAAATAAVPAQPAIAPILTTTQARTAMAIINIFETGHVLGDYGQVTLLQGDPGRLTYGRSQTTLGSGKLHELLQLYCANPGARFGPRLTPWLPAVAAAELSVDQDSQLHNLLRACADDPVMRETQDSFFDTNFWRPALRAATQERLASSALAVAVVYDSFVHGSWGRIRDRTRQAVGPVAAVGERRWIAAYVEQRRQWLANHSLKILHRTVYRMEAFQRLIALGQWGLQLPLVVRDAEISTATLNATPPGCYDGPPPGSRTLMVAQPLARGLDVRLLQLALSDGGAEVKADGVFGGASARCVRELQLVRGLPVTGVADMGLIAELTA